MKINFLDSVYVADPFLISFFFMVIYWRFVKDARIEVSNYVKKSEFNAFRGGIIKFFHQYFFMLVFIISTSLYGYEIVSRDLFYFRCMLIVICLFSFILGAFILAYAKYKNL